MLVFDFITIGNKLFQIRKKMGMTQMEVAIAAGLSERTYADIERGTVNMRIETILKVCKVLQITPNEILTESDTESTIKQSEILQQLATLSPKERETAFSLLSVYINSLK
ncbi:MAG: helix-turn-helix transcriptional regulator [Ruminococcaceae bacterium]|nr:helix-turn-helix transcriptional regulator [Oscillospiraceae bacterium]